MSGLGIARRLAPDPLFQLRHHPRLYLSELWGAFRSPLSISRALHVSRKQVASFWDDLVVRDRFYEKIREQEHRLAPGGALRSSPGGRADSYSEVLYVAIRAIRPKVVVETGVALGYSSSYLLQALHDNQEGTLYSIDLPTTDPGGRVDADGLRDRTYVRSATDTGAVVPDDLRDRWKLTLGPSNPLLTELLQKLGQIDVFFHDSDHSYGNMLWEYQTAWPHIRPGGYLLSDDISRNQAFDDFVATVGGAAYRWYGMPGRRGALQRPVSS